MNNAPPKNEYLLLSRGKWDPNKSNEEIQTAIGRFYSWYEQCVAEGTFKPGQRLAVDCKLVSSIGIIDGPFTEANEVIGGYWFVVAANLEEAAAIASRNPCIECGLSFEIRPIELERASAYRDSNENVGIRK